MISLTMVLVPATLLLAQSAVKTLELSQATVLIGSYCADCHDWAAGYRQLMDSSYVVAGNPDGSLLLARMESGEMPPADPLPDDEEIALVREWILAGAPAPGSGADGVSGATGKVTDIVPRKSFLGFRNKTDFHRFAGWTSGGLLLASGIVGAVHADDLMGAGHELRGALGLSEEDQIGILCSIEINRLWGSSPAQAMRWTHVGLLVTGESLYLSNAITGIGMMGPSRSGLTRGKIHRYALFVHAGLMAAEVALGFATSYALERGDHETVADLGRAHAAIGLAIPVVILGSGAAVEWLPLDR